MASTNPPVKGVTFSFPMGLVSQGDTDIFQASPTLAAGDVLVIKDGTLDGNIDTLPVAITGALMLVSVTLSVDEMTADRIDVLFHDVAGDEWQDVVATIYTSAQPFDTTDAVADAIKAKTDNLPASPAAVGSAMTLAADAITAAKIADDAISSEHLATGAITADAIAANAITSSELADGAITAAKIATDAITAAKIAADAIGASELATSAVTEIKDALTSASASIAAASSGEVTQYRGDTWSFSLTSLGTLADRTSLWFAVKVNKDDHFDNQALVLIEETDGLMYINGAAAGTSGNGSITVDDEDDGDITITLQEQETAKLPIRNDIYYAVKVIIDGVATTKGDGVFNIVAGTVRATS